MTVTDTSDAGPNAGPDAGPDVQPDPGDRPGLLTRTTTSARETGRLFGSVFANRNLRRVQLAFLASATGDWAYATAVAVWAYSDGGAKAVGTFAALRFIVMAVAAPLGAVIADKVARRTFMIVSDALRAVLIAVAAGCIALDLPSVLVYAIALLCVVIGAPFRSAQAGLIPQLARTPDELTASNATASNLENLTSFAGPALGAFLIVVADVEVVFLVNAATFVLSLLLVAGIRVPAAAATGGADGAGHDGDGDGDDEPDESFLAEVSAGFRTIVGHTDLALVSLLAAAQGLVWGALSVLMVVMSVDLLGSGAEGVGYFNSVMGVGAVVGGAVVLARVRLKKVGQDMVLGVLGWALPLLLVALWPSPVTAFAALAVIGLSDPLVNLGLDTIPQRIVPDRVLSRVFGALDASLTGAMALGAFVTPFLDHLLGLRGSLVVVGGLTTGIALLCLGRMRRLDHRLAAPVDLPLVAGLPLFAPLGQAGQEAVARALVTVQAAAGDVVVREGADADGFFIVTAGQVEVTQAGPDGTSRVLRREGPGEFFGEIGLLRDVPRTATVTALEATELRFLDRAAFLSAVGGHGDARRAAEDIASRRLAV